MTDFGEHSYILAHSMAPEWPLYRMTEQTIPGRSVDDWTVVTTVSTMVGGDRFTSVRRAYALADEFDLDELDLDRCRKRLDAARKKALKSVSSQVAESQSKRGDDVTLRQ